MIFRKTFQKTRRNISAGWSFWSLDSDFELKLYIPTHLACSCLVQLLRHGCIPGAISGNPRENIPTRHRKNRLNSAPRPTEKNRVGPAVFQAERLSAPFLVILSHPLPPPLETPPIPTPTPEIFHDGDLLGLV